MSGVPPARGGSSLLPPLLRPERIRGIVFDLDGTLVDSYAAISSSLDHARAAFGLPPVPLPELRRAVGHGLESLIARYLGSERVEAGVALFRARYAEIFATTTVALPGAVPTVRALRARGYALAIASNKPADFTERIATALGAEGVFSSVRGPGPEIPPKPDPRMIRRCLADLQVEPVEAAYVGDMVLDVDSAAQAGVSCILVVGGSSDESDLRATGQTVLEALPSLLELLPARCEPR